MEALVGASLLAMAAARYTPSLKRYSVPVARELAPARRRSRRKPADVVSPKKCVSLFWGGFATQREQAPSHGWCRG